MADQVVQLAPDSSGKKVDNSELTVSSNTVLRQRINIADPTSATELMAVVGGALKAIMPQGADAGNTTTYTNSSAQYVGTFTRTRSVGYVRQLTVLASDVASGLGGTFVFEYSEDGTTATISETRTITDFATVRDFDLLNAGEFYRVKFTPSRTVTAAEHVYITTTQRRQNDGAFVRLANQPMEEMNAALGQTFAFLQAFDSVSFASRSAKRPSSHRSWLVPEIRTNWKYSSIRGRRVAVCRLSLGIILSFIKI